jgi:hypothetical protein
VKALVFEPIAGAVRRARFEKRSTLPVSAACVVASGVRETLGALFGVSLPVRLLEPVVPSPEAWLAIARGAMIYRFRGSIADAAIVFRPADAVALAAAAFGERGCTEIARELSPLERDVLDRTAAAIAGTLTAACGNREREGLERTSSLNGFSTYFEIVLEHDLETRIGVALARDPVPETCAARSLHALGDVAVVAAVRVPLAPLDAGSLAALSVGSFLPLKLPQTFDGTLHVGERTVAQGTCGARAGRFALAVAS